MRTGKRGIVVAAWWAGSLLAGALPGAALAQTPGSAPNQTLLVVSPGTLRGPVSVFLNGRKVGDYAGFIRVDVSNYVRPGQNTLRVTSPDRSGVGEVKIAHAVARDQFRDVTGLKLEGFRAPAEGTRLSFDLPAGAGPRARAAGLGRALLTVNPTTMDRPFSVYLNGRKLGDYLKYGQVDVTPYLRAGRNTLRVVWTDTNGIASVELAHAADGKTYRTLTEVTFQGFRANPREKTVEFNLP